MSRGRAVRLTKTIENVRHELAADALPRIADDDLTIDPTCESLTATRPPLSVNFTAFDNRFQITCWSLFASPDTIAGVRVEVRVDP